MALLWLLYDSMSEGYHLRAVGLAVQRTKGVMENQRCNTCFLRLEQIRGTARPKVNSGSALKQSVGYPCCPQITERYGRMAPK